MIKSLENFGIVALLPVLASCGGGGSSSQPTELGNNGSTSDSEGFIYPYIVSEIGSYEDTVSNNFLPGSGELLDLLRDDSQSWNMARVEGVLYDRDVSVAQYYRENPDKAVLCEKGELNYNGTKSTVSSWGYSLAGLGESCTQEVYDSIDSLYEGTAVSEFEEELSSSIDYKAVFGDQSKDSSLENYFFANTSAHEFDESTALYGDIDYHSERVSVDGAEALVEATEVNSLRLFEVDGDSLDNFTAKNAVTYSNLNDASDQYGVWNSSYVRTWTEQGTEFVLTVERINANAINSIGEFNYELDVVGSSEYDVQVSIVHKEDGYQVTHTRNGVTQSGEFTYYGR